MEITEDFASGEPIEGKRDDIATKAKELALKTRRAGKGYLHGKFREEFEVVPRTQTSPLFQSIQGFDQGRTLNNAQSMEKDIHEIRFPHELWSPYNRDHLYRWGLTSAAYGTEEYYSDFVRRGNVESSKDDWTQYELFMPINMQRTGGYVTMLIAVPPEIAHEIDTNVTADSSFIIAYRDALFPEIFKRQQEGEVGEYEPFPPREIVLRNLRETSNAKVGQVINLTPQSG